MNAIFRYLLLSLLSIISISVLAQDVTVSGTVINNNAEPLKGATVFIGGSERIMATDENGRFNFAHVPPGTFQLSAQMIGYAPLTQNIIVKNIPVTVDMKMQVKSVNLHQVTIGTKKASKKNLKLFTEIFLGQSVNAKQCVILNPEIIDFSTQKGHLFANSDDFLIIENKRLGYRLHYLLKGFDYSNTIGVVLYHGDCSFEELKGTDEQKKHWAKNRFEAYKGSFMHFLRSAYANNTLENGFITKPMYGYTTYKYGDDTIRLQDHIIVKNRSVMFDSLLTAIDTNFTSFKFKQPLFITYDPKAAAYFASHQSDIKEGASVNEKGSILKLVTSQAIIDKKGSYTDYHDFFIQGYWASARVGDQLPIEYKPPMPDIPRRNVHTNPILASLQKWTDSIPQEKAYLHMDKSYYVPGDTIWFKGYLTSGSRHRLSTISGAAYVDLINDENHLIKTLKLPVDTGTISGDLILNEDVKAGSYRIRAYTQWMRNAGEDYFFDHTFTVGDPKTFVDNTKQALSTQETDVQFFPESGNLVNNITSRIAFKAVAPNGLGAAISGKVTDNANNEVAEFSTLHAGMGSFLLKPLPGKTYTANVKFANGSLKDIKLPAALNEGYVLSVYQPNKDSVLIRIQASAALQHSTLNLVVHNSGEVIFSSPIDIRAAITSVWFDKKIFPGGIAQFTIFDSNNQPLNERIVFIKSDDHMQMVIKTPKTAYQSKEPITLELDAKESEGTPVAANFSVAVIDENKAPVDEDAESTIFSNILLTSDIKGYVEKPNYYFSADTDEVNKALDNLMLTQGYRRFEWKSLDSVTSAKPEFAAEGLNYTISGIVTTLTHRPLPNADIMLLSMNARIHKATTTDANGRFRFDSLMFADSAKFAIQAKTKENSDHAIITLDSIPKVAVSIKPNIADVAIIKTHLQQAVQDGKPIKLTGHILKQVNIKAIRNEEGSKIAPQGLVHLPDEESADQILRIPDPESYITLATYLQGRLAGIRVEQDKNGLFRLVDTRPSMNLASNVSQADNNGIGIVLDGIPLQPGIEVHDALTGGVLPEDIDRIDVVRTNLAMVNLFGKALFIIRKAKSARKHYTPNIVNTIPKGFNWTRQFYSPHYDHPADNTKPDTRTTIYWNPYVNTDASGKATINFYNADGPGNYRVVIEGINAAGELGRQVYHYKVE
jgi:hypothetical protein